MVALCAARFRKVPSGSPSSVSHPAHVAKIAHFCAGREHHQHPLVDRIDEHYAVTPTRPEHSAMALRAHAVALFSLAIVSMIEPNGGLT